MATATSTGPSSSRNSVLWTALVIGYAALMLFPVFWIGTIMFKPEAVMFERPTAWLFSPTLDHFDYVLAHGFLGNLGTSFIVGTASTLLIVVIGTPAAYAFARFEMWRRDPSDVSTPLARISHQFLLRHRKSRRGCVALHSSILEV